MAKISKAVLGNFGGKVGNVVGRKFRTENVVAAYQPIVHNPRTTAQTITRNRIGVLSQYSRALTYAILLGMKKVSNGTKWSPRNMFVKLNWEATVATTASNPAITMSQIKVSKGNLSQFTFGAPHFSDTPQHIICTYSESIIAGEDTDYEVFMVAVCPDTMNSVVVSSKDAGQVSGTLDMEVPYAWNGMKAHVYGFVRYNGSDIAEHAIYKGDVSDSSYIGQGNIE